jgi:uncharacterized protein with NRDE domain
MCLAIVAVASHPDWPLIIAANRDEFHARPSRAAEPWSDAPQIVAGRDLQGGGTWLGVTTQGRVALLTNVREPGRQLPQAPSRGRLVESFLRQEQSAGDFARVIERDAMVYNGFNLVVGDSSGLWYGSNRSGPSARQLGSGVSGLSNAALDTPWPKLTRTRRALADYLAAAKSLDPESLFAILADRSRPADSELPDTGVGLEAERLLGSAFIAHATYGTRCSTLVLQRADGQLTVHERSYGPSGSRAGEVSWQIQVGAAGGGAIQIQGLRNGL